MTGPSRHDNSSQWLSPSPPSLGQRIENWSSYTGNTKSGLWHLHLATRDSSSQFTDCTEKNRIIDTSQIWWHNMCSSSQVRPFQIDTLNDQTATKHTITYITVWHRVLFQVKVTNLFVPVPYLHTPNSVVSDLSVRHLQGFVPDLQVLTMTINDQ